jgi:phenylacetate-CoA ligase
LIAYSDMLDVLGRQGFDPLAEVQAVSDRGVRPISAWVTGKFGMQAREDDDRNPYLSIVVELAPGVTPDDSKTVATTESILRHLLRLNSEFAHYVPTDRQHPRVVLASPGDPAYFPTGVKHRYTRK